MCLFAYFAVPVIHGGFVKLLSKFKGDLRVFEGALGADHHFISFMADGHSRLGHVTNLPGGKAHACVNTREPAQYADYISNPFIDWDRSKFKKKWINKSNLALLTQRFHVLIKVFAVNQLPGGTEGVNHVEGLQGYLQSKVCKLQLSQDHSPQSCFCLLLLCTLVGGVWLPIGQETLL